MRYDTSPTARALLALEAIQDSPGITAQRLGDHLGVTERAARRYVAILREADLPIESVTGPHGGYRVGRGLRLPPLMFTAAEALGLVMAVLEGHRGAADPTELVGAALSKILRVLPQQVAEPVRAVRRVTGPPPDPSLRVDPALTAKLVEACTSSRRVRIDYRLEDGRERPMEVDPWAVVLRHGRWYLLGWSQTSDAQRALRDRPGPVGLHDVAAAFDAARGPRRPADPRGTPLPGLAPRGRRAPAGRPRRGLAMAPAQPRTPRGGRGRHPAAGHDRRARVVRPPAGRHAARPSRWSGHPRSCRPPRTSPRASSRPPALPTPPAAAPIADPARAGTTPSRQPTEQPTSTGPRALG